MASQAIIRRSRLLHRPALLVVSAVALLMTALAGCSGVASDVAGNWSGPLVLTEDETTGTLYVTLVDVSDEMEGYTGTNLEGLARYCLGDETGTFDLFGEVDPDGNIVAMRFRSTDESVIWRYYPDGGRWTGEMLTFSGPYSYDPTAQFISSSTDLETTVTVMLERTDAGAADVVCP